jgi:hypothetical protein
MYMYLHATDTARLDIELVEILLKLLLLSLKNFTAFQKEIGFRRAPVPTTVIYQIHQLLGENQLPDNSRGQIYATHNLGLGCLEFPSKGDMATPGLQGGFGG